MTSTRALQNILISLLAVITWSASGFGSTITKVKGKGVVINLAEDEAEKGDTFYAISDAGKKTAIIQIVKVTGSKAIGKITKGKAKDGQTVTKKGGGGGGGHSDDEDSSASHSSKSNFYVGGLVSYSLDSMAIKLTNQAKTASETLDSSGSGIGFQAVADYDFSSTFGMRLVLGMEQFSVKGTAKSAYCKNFTSTACTTEINYFVGDAIGKINLLDGSVGLWIGGGGSLMFPSSKSTTALDESSISTTFAFLLGGGLDFKFGSMKVPVGVEYGILPSSDDVKTSIIKIKAGLMFAL